MEYPCGVVGIEDGIIEDVSFSGLHVTSAGGGTAADAAREVPERRTSSLEPSFMKTLPAHGLYARHVRNLGVSDARFEVERADARPAIALENVNGAVIDGLTSTKAKQNAVRAAQDCRNIAIGQIETFPGENA